MQCGCECVLCDIEVNGEVTEDVTDSTLCNQLFLEDGKRIDCISRNDRRCAAEFSSPEQLPFCAIEQPSQWPPLYDLSNALNLTDLEVNDTEAGGSPPGPEVLGGDDASAEDAPEPSAEPITRPTEYMYTSESAFGDAAMERIVRQPQPGALTTDATIADELQVLPLTR